MKKRFILLIDFSEYSSNLIKYACNWGKELNAEILLVHKTIVLTPAFTSDESKQQMVQHTNEEALQKLKNIAKEFIPPAIQVSFSVSENNLTITLTKLLAEPFDNLIFTGVKGTALLKQIFIGSTALQVIENVNSIIVAIPKEISVFSPHNIFIAVTEKHPFNILELKKILRFIEQKNTCITFFNLAKTTKRTKEIEKQLHDLSNLFAQEFNTKTAIYECNNPFDGIKKILNNKQEEMLIVQKGSRLMTDHFFRRFLINELVYEGQIPLIVLP